MVALQPDALFAIMEAEDNVIDNEILLEEDDLPPLFAAIIPFMRRSLNRVERFLLHIRCQHIVWTNSKDIS